MASIVMFLRALMSCRLTPNEEPTAAASLSAVKLYRSVAGDHHEFIIETTCGANDMDEGFHWNIIKNHLLM
ncbi:hypothetical protein HID58_016785 [Brassica napus]|uniref:Uncharacterized protein n=2 Tax=Brassica TaxID=3705 RepID=A0A3P5ZAX2_BRACM|nr:uncharacterized protein LOC111215969 [Brassica napus]KAH0924529.1 hypothetical protein HID58_016785 [Brassica napus]CAF2093244.1 unnamed protein product [Brassica napus]CAG7873549.1 unnamed protein product [Brassica rapa]VDC69348.1 unnamed protein product [Brassica rapa]